MLNTISRDLKFNLITYIEAGAFSGLTALSYLLLLMIVEAILCRQHYDCRNRKRQAVKAFQDS